MKPFQRAQSWLEGVPRSNLGAAFSSFRQKYSLEVRG